MASSIMPFPFSGHIPSRDGLTNWNMADAEPYSLKIDNDRSAGLVATLERPKLLFDEMTGEPTHIYTAAAALPKDACARCTHSGRVGACIDCKITSQYEKGVYTMVRPLRQASKI